MSNPDIITKEKTEEAEPASRHRGPTLARMTGKIDQKLLIELVRNEPRLWDKRNKSYHNRDAKCELWESIGKQLHVTDAEVKNKWQNLRSNYMRERRRLKTIPSRAEADGAKIGWPFFSMMSFLDDSLRMRRTTRSVPGDSEDFATSSASEHENLDESVISCVSQERKVRPEADPQVQVAPANLKEKIRKQNGLDNEVDGQYRKKLEKLSSAPIDSDDPDLLFFKSLLPQIKQLDSNENLSFKVEVAQLLLRKLQSAIHTSSTSTMNVTKPQNL